MKKILSFALVAAIGLGSMNMHATDAKSENATNTTSKRAYIWPAVQVGMGVVMTLGGILDLFMRFHVLPRNEKTFNSTVASKNLPDEEKKYVAYLQSFAKSRSLHFGGLVLLSGILEIQNGWYSLKTVKRIRSIQKRTEATLKLGAKVKDEAKKIKKEQVQA